MPLLNSSTDEHTIIFAAMGAGMRICDLLLRWLSYVLGVQHAACTNYVAVINTHDTMRTQRNPHAVSHTLFAPVEVLMKSGLSSRTQRELHFGVPSSFVLD